MTESLVFIVDDDVASASSLQALMMSDGLDSEVYHSAESFLDAYREKRAGCLLVDIRLGGMSGLDLQEAMVNAGAPLGIIVISGHADEAARQQAEANGAIAVLPKPVDGSRICDVVRKALVQQQCLPLEE